MVWKKLVGGSVLSASLLLGGLTPIITEANDIEKSFETDTAVYDLSMKDEITSSLVPLEDGGIALAADYTVTSNVKRYLVPPLVSATATSSSTTSLDYIEATVRAYYDTGGLMGTASDSAKKSSYAGAQYSSGFKFIDMAYGSHVYKNAGYKDIYHETSTD